MIRRALLGGAVMLAVSVTGTPQAHAQNFRFLCNGMNADGSVESDGCPSCDSSHAPRWQPAILNFRVDLATVPSGMSGSQWNTIVNASMGAWNNVSGQTLSISNSGNTVNRQFGQDDNNHELFWITNGMEWQSKVGSGINGALGVTLPRYRYCGNPATLEDSDLVLNGASSNWCWNPTNAQCNSAQSTLVHEMGHAFGLGHPCTFCEWAVMSAQAGYDPEYPLFADQQGIRALYPGTPGGIGYGCTNNSNCNSNKCISTATGSGTISYCSQTCGTCPEGFTCQDVSGQGMVCVFSTGSAAMPAGPGESCTQRPCRSDLLCAGSDNDYTCYTKCTSPGTTAGCGTNEECVGIQGGGGVCVTTSGSAGLGQICTGSALCQSGLVCIVETQGATSGICRQECTPPNGACPAGEACAPLTSGGACFPAAGEGEACNDAVCSPGMVCVIDAPNNGAHCYVDCTSGMACPSGRVCNRYNQGTSNEFGICETTAVSSSSSSGGSSGTSGTSGTSGNTSSSGGTSGGSSGGTSGGSSGTSGGGCVGGGSVGAGGNCGSSTDCRLDSGCNAMQCVANGAGNVCVSTCDPRLGHYDCDEDTTAGCRPNDPADLSAGGLCIPGAVGSGRVGAACTSGEDCEYGVCSNNKCSVWCNDDGSCPDSSYTCDMDAAPYPGVCRPSATGTSPFACNCLAAQPGLPGGLVALGVLALCWPRRRRR